MSMVHLQRWWAIRRRTWCVGSSSERSIRIWWPLVGVQVSCWMRNDDSHGLTTLPPHRQMKQNSAIAATTTGIAHVQAAPKLVLELLLLESSAWMATWHVCIDGAQG